MVTEVPKASILKYGRTVFNLGGNKYRLVVRINYDYATIYTRFIGIHAQYAQIDAQTITGKPSWIFSRSRMRRAMHAALAQIEALMGAKRDTPDGGRLDVLVKLVVLKTQVRAARVWREEAQPWLTTTLVIEMLDKNAQKREPYPITWAEQAQLLTRLPPHLQHMVELVRTCLQRYAAATVARLLEAANSVLQTRDRTMVLRVVNG